MVPAIPKPSNMRSGMCGNLLGKKPIFGICLGHQIMGLALGGKTYKLKFGHHGGNHPVLNIERNQVEITAQNHGFAVDPESLNLNDDQHHAHQFERQHGRRLGASLAAGVQRSISSRSVAGPARFVLLCFKKFFEMMKEDA